jgi:cytochrome c oxidase subunit 2
VKRLVAFLLPVAAAGCHYAALDRASPEADRITSLHNLMFVICVAVFLALMGFLAAALLRNAGLPSPEAERRRGIWVAAGAILSSLLLLILLTASVLTGRSIATPAGPNALEIQIIGHQWWWEVHYPAALSDQEVVTANEIHVPVGRPVRLRLSSGDVIHSFWVPNLNGKRDLIPGRLTTLTFQARREATYDGRCAEFCGYQHAHMGFQLVAQTPAEFEAWLADQRRPAADPVDAATARGLHVFLTGPCTLCHTIRGTPAFGHKAPDLTHLASRATIAAATLPNTPGHLAGWIADAQRIKPGNRMPPNILASTDLLDLVAYLRSLR